jgi:Domain of unknown function (DUF4105)
MCSFVRGLRRFILIVFAVLVAAPLVAWSTGALYYDFPTSAHLRAAMAICWTTGAFALSFFGGWRGRVLAILGFAFIVAWWLTLRPSQHEDWQPQVATLAYSERHGDRLRVFNIRNFEYRSATDFTPRYDTRVFDLGNLRALDLFINYWGSPYMAHPIVSFDFGSQGHLCFSIETRPKRGQNYSTLGGLYRQFELIYIAADEGDVVRLRTNYKMEDIYLYRLTLSPEEVKTRLMDYLGRLNELHAQAAWYNAVTANCTTSIRAQHARAAQSSWDWRMLVNGFADQMLYERHALAGNLPFAQLKAQALINKRAQEAGDALDFSQRIRADLAGF